VVTTLVSWACFNLDRAVSDWRSKRTEQLRIVLDMTHGV